MLPHAAVRVQGAVSLLLLAFAVARVWAWGLADVYALGSASHVLHTASLLGCSFTLLAACYHPRLPNAPACTRTARASLLARVRFCCEYDWCAMYACVCFSILADAAVCYREQSGLLVWLAYVDILVSSWYVAAAFMCYVVFTPPAFVLLSLASVSMPHCASADGPLAPTRFLLTGLLLAAPLAYVWPLLLTADAPAAGLRTTQWLALSNATCLALVVALSYAQRLPSIGSTSVARHLVALFALIAAAALREWTLAASPR